MIRFILFLILFYIIYKVLQYFLRYFTASTKNKDSFKTNPPAKTKYKDVEEADFREIKPEDNDESNEKK